MSTYLQWVAIIYRTSIRGSNIYTQHTSGKYTTIYFSQTNSPPTPKNKKIKKLPIPKFNGLELCLIAVKKVTRPLTENLTANLTAKEKLGETAI